MKINQNKRLTTPSKMLKECCSDKEESKYLVNTYLTRAEYLTKQEQEELGAKEGIVIIESSLYGKDLKQEFDEILAEANNYNKAFDLYKKFMVDSVTNSMDLAKKLVEQKNSR